MTVCDKHRTLHAEVQAWLDVGHFINRAVALTARKYSVSDREVMTAYLIVRNDESTNRYNDDALVRLHDAMQQRCQRSNVVDIDVARRRRKKVLQ